MKRFVSLALAAAMTLSIAPVAAFADTNNRVVGSPVVSKDTTLNGDNAPTLAIENNRGDIVAGNGLEFALVLDGAEFDNINMLEFEGGTVGTSTTYEDILKTPENYGLTISKYNSKKIYLSFAKNSQLLPVEGEELKIKLSGVKVTGDTAKVTIDSTNSVVYGSTHTFAKAADGNAIITVDGKKDFPDGGTVNDIIVEEVTGTSITGDAVFKLKLNSGFKFDSVPTLSAVKGGTLTKDDNYTVLKEGDRDITITINDGALTDDISIFKIQGIKIAEDGAKYGDTAEITITGEQGAKDITKTTLEMGKYIDYGVSVSTEDKDLPVVYSGRTAKDNDNNETLKLTVKEGVTDSWFLDSRKTTFTFPEGVKVREVNIIDKDSSGITSLSTDKFAIDGNVVTFSGAGKDTDSDGKLKKSELVVTFDLDVAPNFTGDITCEVGGPAVNENQKVTLAKAIAPVTVEAVKTPVSIDYRNVAVGDITLTEAEAGLWKKGEKIILDVENMSFESGIKAEVVEGDGEIKKLDVNRGSGTVTIEVDSESSKSPMKIKLSGISLYLDRTLPVGDYALSIVTGEINNDTNLEKNSVMFQNYNSKDGNDPSKGDFGFDVDEVEVMKDYVTVTTAGRDQGTTFTTEVVVTIDSTTMKVDGKDVTLDTPAYLSAEGWTMLPIRAVTEALATTSNTQPVDWIPGNPGTIIIRYGDKTVSMTLGSTTMYINGTPIPMSTAPTIVNDRAFLPMRDLGRALGLTENEIVWDAATRTATLNPSTTNTTTNQ